LTINVFEESASADTEGEMCCKLEAEGDETMRAEELPSDEVRREMEEVEVLMAEISWYGIFSTRSIISKFLGRSLEELVGGSIWMDRHKSV
jgi:hypothetical protein